MSKIADKFDTALKATTKKTKKKVVKKEVYQLSVPKKVLQAIKDFLKYKKAQKQSEIKMRNVEKTIISHCQRFIDDEALKGNYHPTLEIVDGKIAIKYITLDSFKFPSEELKVKEIKKVLGKKAYNEATETISNVSLKPEVFTDKKLKKQLLDLMGKEFSTFFETTKTVVLKEGFAEKMYKIAKGKLHKLDQIRELLPQKKASIR